MDAKGLGAPVKKTVGTLMRGLEWFLGLMLILTICLNFVNVIGRYVFNKSILGAEEVQVFALIWMAFLGTAVVTWRNMHLRMDALSNRFPPSIRKTLRVAEFVICLFVVGYTVVQSWDYVSRMMMLGYESDVAHIPMWIPHAAVLTGLVLIVLLLLAATITGGEKPVGGDAESGSAQP